MAVPVRVPLGAGVSGDGRSDGGLEPGLGLAVLGEVARLEGGVAVVERLLGLRGGLGQRRRSPCTRVVVDRLLAVPPGGGVVV